MSGNCSSRCPAPGTHPTFGACIRAMNVKVGYCRSAVGHDATRQKKWDSELAEYKSARAQGIQPEGTSLAQTRRAVEASNKVGLAYDAGTRTFGSAA